MNPRDSFMNVVEGICREDDRYPVDAYLFVREALDVTAKMLEKPRTGLERHVSGRELLEGIRMVALQEFGPMARTVLRTWNVRGTEDFGEIVFNLVSAGVLGKTDEDTRADFKEGYDFDDAFVTPFLPDSAKPAGNAAAGKGTQARGEAQGGDTKTGEAA